MYEDLRQFLVPGFLTSTLALNGHTYGFRSLVPSDLWLVNQIARDTDPEWRVRLLAASLWMVDGVVLLDSPEAAAVTYRALCRSSSVVIREGFGTLVGFFRRWRDAQKYLESFLYEEESRRLWQGCRSGATPLWGRTSIPGLSRLGSNPVQSAWAAWNHLEDSRETQEYEWSLTKVHISLQSHKAAQNVEARDRSRLETERNRRRAVREEAELAWRGKDEERRRRRSSTWGGASAKDLAEEMRRWVSGEMDAHDRIVAEYKERIRSEKLAREAEAARWRAAQEARRSTTTESEARAAWVAYTPEQLARHLPARPFSGTRQVVDETQERLFDTYLREEPVAGPVRVEAGRVTFAPEAVEEKNSEPLSLDDQVAQHLPKWNGS
jgi:hypothetical protein